MVEELGGNLRVERQLLKRVIDAVYASFTTDELFTRFMSKLSCKFVQILTALNRQEKWKVVRGRADASRFVVRDEIQFS